MERNLEFFQSLGPLGSGKNKTNKHKHFRRDSLRDKQEPSLGQMGPLPGTKWDPSLGQTGLSMLNSTVKIAILSRLSLGWVGVCRWDDCPTRTVRKMFMCFPFIVFCSQWVFGKKHPSHDGIFSGQNSAKKMPKIITSHDILKLLKQVSEKSACP